MDSKLKLIVDSFGDSKVKLDEPLKDHTLLQVGGKASLFFVAFSNREIIKIEEMARDLKIPLFIFGTGSKIMMESGFRGVVIKNRTSNIQVVGVKGKVSRAGMGVAEAVVEVDAGVSLNKLSEFLDSQKLQSGGIKNVPGTVGGNLFLNRFLRDSVKMVKAIEEGSTEEIKIESLNLRKHVILSVVFNFKASGDV